MKSKQQSASGSLIYVGIGSLLIVLLIIFTFFMAYNRFLVNRSVNMLEASLQQISYAKNVQEIRTLGVFMDEIMSSELSGVKLNFKSISRLQFSKTLLEQSQEMRQVQDVKMLLEETLQSRKKAASGWNYWLDRLAEIWRKWTGQDERAGYGQARSGRELSPEEKENYRAAKKMERAGDLPQAVDQYEKLIFTAADSKHALDIKIDLIYGYVRIGRLDKARHLLEQMSAGYASDRDREIMKMLEQMIQEKELSLVKVDELIETLKQAKDAHESQRICFQIGTYYYQLLNYKNAAEFFEKASAFAPRSELGSKALFYQGLALKAAKKTDASSRVFQEIVGQSPESELAVNSSYQIADNYHMVGDYGKAAEEFSRFANKAGPRDSLASLAQFRSAYTQLYDLGDPVRAQKEFEKLKHDFAGDRFAEYSKTEVEPVAKTNINYYGYLFLLKGLWVEARNALEEAVRTDAEDFVASAGLSVALAELGEQEQAFAYIENAVDLNTNAFTLATRGYVKAAAGQYADALQDYQAALSMDSQNIDILVNLGITQIKLKDYDSALKTFQRFLEACEGCAAGYHYVGMALLEKKVFLDAIENFEKALQTRPDLAEARYALAQACFHAGKLERARLEVSELIKEKPDFAPAKKLLQQLGQGGAA